jgi:hypothetical protein
VRLALRCAVGAGCSGALTVHARGRRIGRARYMLDAGATRAVAVTISGAGRRLLRQVGRLRVSVRVTAGGQRTQRRLVIRG